MRFYLLHAHNEVKGKITISLREGKKKRKLKYLL